MGGEGNEGLELGVKESSSPEVQQTFPRAPVSPGSSWCISTMDRDKGPPYTSFLQDFKALLWGLGTKIRVKRDG